jgi:hypothetical protein
MVAVSFHIVLMRPFSPCLKEFVIEGELACVTHLTWVAVLEITSQTLLSTLTETIPFKNPYPDINKV